MTTLLFPVVEVGSATRCVSSGVPQSRLWRWQSRARSRWRSSRCRLQGHGRRTPDRITAVSAMWTGPVGIWWRRRIDAHQRTSVWRDSASADWTSSMIKPRLHRQTDAPGVRRCRPGYKTRISGCHLHRHADSDARAIRRSRIVVVS